MFNKGDVLDVVTEFPDIAGDFVKRDRYTVTSDQHGWYTIRPLYDPNNNGYIVDAGSLMSCSEISLPVGDQVQLGDVVSNCDCGGYKTYGTMDDMVHSRWCSSVVKEKI